MIESKYLKDDVKNIRQLCTIPALKSFETGDLAKLLKLSKIRQYADKESIIQEGATDQWLYFLLSGKIRISKNGVLICTIDNTGEVFGEMRIIDGLSRSTSIHAEGQTTCLAVDTSAKHRLDTDEESENLLTLLYKVMMEYISVRLRLSNEKLIEAQQEIARLKKCIPATKPKDQKKQAAHKEFVYTGIIETATGG
ncbi:MAG: cyclic nucleotide-binding domain-containing protein [Desulfobacterales bacterium]|uniref:Cyclic nucleotide-binding domain-containing protein n=1 Tax=Candidatus Desulfatibia vada TaxID=2841696 RepID=A0A8J6NT23_9BACT|nr:cyclic nucleotide-binding domain-containing protein [Candidatus Desulfatibia vada]MBL6971769.1 cyclic nucleotide-binding domain-containing protein [Desulfobacterales bacterium]